MARVRHASCALALSLASGCADGVSVGSMPLAPERTAPSTTPSQGITTPNNLGGGAGQNGSFNEPHEFVLDLATGASHACVRTFEGYVHCWGSNEYGQLGRTPSEFESIPSVAGHGALALHLFAGPTQTAVLDKSRQLGHWGLYAPRNDDGVTPWSQHDTPGVGPLAGVAFGERFALAWDSRGELIAWGAPDGASLTTAFLIKPVRVHLGFPIAHAAVWSRDGEGHGCIVVPWGLVGCWGLNDRSQLGPPGSDLGILHVPPVDHVASVSLGDRFTCALRSDSKALCWGANNVGQLGDTTTRDHGTPSLVAVPMEVYGIATGAHHACALSRDGGVWCWGANDRGQLGDGSLELFSATPRRVQGLPKSTSVATGDDFTCARTEDGRAWCWGNNSLGQLGDGTQVTRAEPRPILL